MYLFIVLHGRAGRCWLCLFRVLFYLFFGLCCLHCAVKHFQAFVTILPFHGVVTIRLPIRMHDPNTMDYLKKFVTKWL